MSKHTEQIVLGINKLASEQNGFENTMSYMNQAFTIIKSEKDKETRAKLAIITLVNLGKVFKDMCYYSEAISSLKKALKIAKSTPTELVFIGKAGLTLCSIYSEQKNHKEALISLQKSIDLLKPHCLENLELISTLVFCYQNAGIQCEKLQMQDQAKKMYRNGWKLSNQHLGPNSPLTKTLKQNSVFCSFSDKKSKYQQLCNSISISPRPKSHSIIKRKIISNPYTRSNFYLSPQLPLNISLTPMIFHIRKNKK